VLAEHDPAALARAERVARETDVAPRYGDVAIELAGLLPARDAARVPINRALREALERVALALSLEARAEAEPLAARAPEPPTPPVGPPRPRRVA
jgi:hypothetical protein